MSNDDDKKFPGPESENTHDRFYEAVARFDKGDYSGAGMVMSQTLGSLQRKELMDEQGWTNESFDMWMAKGLRAGAGLVQGDTEAGRKSTVILADNLATST